MPFVRQLIQETISTGNMEDAFYVCNVDDLLDKHHNWLLKMGPRVRPFYAVKCNDSRVVVEILAALGLSFDCASRAEIDAILNTGTPASNIVYANPCKSIPSLVYARKVGVDLMTFDSEDELLKIRDVFPEARLVLRIKVDDSHAKYHLSKKFGAALESVPSLLSLAKHLGLNVMGVSFHVGSGGDSAQAFGAAIADARIAFNLAKDFGFEMSLLDIGGGYPGGSDMTEKNLFDQIAAVVQDSLEKHFPLEENATLDVIAEPGKYYVQSAFILSTLILGKRTDIVPDEMGGCVVNYFLNDGMYGSMSNTTFAEGELIPVPEIGEQELQDRVVRVSAVWGPTCDSLDIIHKRIFLPEMRVGEWMTFTDMGAYTMSLGTKFNGFTMPILKTHASIDSIRALILTPAWNRLADYMGLDNESVSSLSDESLVHRVWEYIHVPE